MMQQTIAVFDYDDTLVTGDAFWPFLIDVAGRVQTATAFIESLMLLGWARLTSQQNPETGGHRTFIKAHLVRRLLAGRLLADITAALPKLQRWQTWNEPMRQALLDHVAKGHHVVIASGSLNLYLPTLLKDIPHNAIICTDVGIANGVITGEFTSGNCVRKRKAALVKAYMDTHGPFADSWGYGNYPHDVPMLELMRQRIIV